VQAQAFSVATRAPGLRRAVLRVRVPVHLHALLAAGTQKLTAWEGIVSQLYAEALKKQLEKGHTVRVYFSDKPPYGAVFPPGAYRCHPNVIALDINYNFEIPILDLCIDAESISGTFSFNSKPELVIVPWTAVMQMIDLNEAPEVPKTKPPQPATEKLKKPRRALPAGWAVIEGGANKEVA
jgi:hypothetical protein